MKKSTICKECEFAERRLSKAKGSGATTDEPTGICLSPNAPIHEYVNGFSLCHKINEGNCKFFKPCAGKSNKGKQP